MQLARVPEVEEPRVAAVLWDLLRCDQFHIIAISRVQEHSYHQELIYGETLREVRGAGIFHR